MVVSELFWIRAPFSTQRHGLASWSFTIGVLLVPHYPPRNPAVKHKHSRELAGKMCVWPESHVMEETSFKQKYLLEIARKLLVVVRRALCALCVRSWYCVLSLSPFSNSILCVAITAADLVSSYPIIIQNVGLVAADKHLHSTGQLWSELFIDCRSPPPLFISPRSALDNFDIDINVALSRWRINEDTVLNRHLDME